MNQFYFIINHNFRRFFHSQFYLISLLWPIIFNFKERSYIAFDEGYYALQARWILETGNWLAPMWWGSPVYDRTIGVQWLIASSQYIFGPTIWAAHLPSIISGIVALVLTREITKTFVGNTYSWISLFILSTTYLWVDYLHLATQDMPLLAFELLGIWSIIQYDKSNKEVYLFLFGLWIGPAFILKSVMVLLPILALSPYIIIFQKKLLISRFFWLGLLFGFCPVLIWIFFSINKYGFNEFTLLFRKVQYLSTSSVYSNSFLYYFWNIPLNSFPWCLFAMFGVLKNFKDSNLKHNLILICYPALIFLMLSLFKTKTPYYALQLTPFIAINANIGLQYTLNKHSFIYKYIKAMLFSFGLIICLGLIIYSLSHLQIIFSDKRLLIYLTMISCISLSWFLTSLQQNKRKSIIFLLTGQFLAFVLLVQSSSLTDRDPSLRGVIQQERVASILHSREINVLITSDLDNQAFSKLIKLALYTPKLSSRIDSLNHLPKNNYLWINDFDYASIPKDKINILLSDKELKPWKLVSADLQ